MSNATKVCCGGTPGSRDSRRLINVFGIVLPAFLALISIAGGAAAMPGVFHENTCPTRIANGPGGALYVTDPDQGSVFIYDSNLVAIGEIKSVGSPLGIAVDARGWIYVGDDAADCIRVFNAEGESAAVFGEGLLRRPTDMDIDFDGNLYVADSFASNVLVFDSMGNHVRTIGSPGTANGQLSFPVSATVAYYLSTNGVATGELLVGDQNNHRVQAFDLNGNYLRKFGQNVPSFGTNWYGTFNFVQSVAVDDLYNYHSLDSYYANVQVFNRASGTYREYYGEFGNGPGQLNLPQDVVMTDSGSFVVANAGNGTLQPLRTTGVVSAVISTALIGENLPAGSTVGVFSADPPEAGSNVFLLVGGPGSAANSMFVIEGSELKTAVPLDREAGAEMRIRVKAATSNSINLARATEITVTVSNVNEAPTGLVLQAAALYENLPSNSVVGTLATSDPDADDTFTYSLVAGAGDDDNAKFNIAGDALEVTGAFDYEMVQSASIRVRTRDAGGLEYEGSMIIPVGNVGEVTDPDTDGDGMPDWWELAVSGGATNVEVTADNDMDGMNNLQEWIALTDPADNSSLLEVWKSAFEQTGDHGILQWIGSQDRMYAIEWTSDLAGGAWSVVYSNIVATPPVNVVTDEVHSAADGPGFLRLKVRLPQ